MLVHRLLRCGLLSVTTLLATEPAFHPHRLATAATDIVVAIETDTPGTFSVQNTWKGHLPVGATLSLPAMAPWQTDRAKQVYNTSDEFGYVPVAQLHPSAVVLFLKGSSGPTGMKWLPADFTGSMQASFAWIEAGTVYAFCQPTNPGDVMLLRHGPEDALRHIVDTVVKEQQAGRTPAPYPELGCSLRTADGIESRTE